MLYVDDLDSSDFQFFQSSYQAFGDPSKSTNLQLLPLSLSYSTAFFQYFCTVEEYVCLFDFIYSHSAVL